MRSVEREALCALTGPARRWCGDGEAQRGGAGADGKGEGDGGTSDDADGGDGLDGPRRAEAREAVRETTYGAWSAASTGGGR